MYRDFDQSPILVSEGMYDRQCCCRRDVPDYASFLFSMPGWEPSLGGFPALSGAVGQFLIKDVVLLGAALWSLGEAMTATKEPAPEA